MLARLASLGRLSTMVVALLQVHIKNGFFAPTGFEFPLSLLGSTLLLVITGAGGWSIDSLIGSRSKQDEPEVQPERIRIAA